MKRMIALYILLAAGPAFAQNQTVLQAPTEKERIFTGNETGPCWAVAAGVGYHTMRWEKIGTVSGGTVKLQGSNDSACATVTDIIAAQAATTSGTVNGTAGVYRYVQLVFASYAGSGSVRVFYAGDKSAAALGSAVTVTSGNITVSDGAGALNVICDSGCAGGTQYTEDVAATADPIGTAINLIRADTPGAVTTTNGDNVALRGTNYGAMYAQIVSSAGAFIDTFGGGTQYTEGDTDASISGTALLFEGAADTLVAAPGTAADGLLVNLGSNNDVTVTSGTITAVTTVTNPVTVTDGAGALNVIVDSGTITAVTTITNAVTVTDGAGALNVIVDSGTITAVTSITNPVRISDGTDVALVSAGGELSVTCGNCSGTGVSHVDDAAFTVTSDDIVPIAGMFDDSSPDSVNEGDAGVVRMSANRNLFATLRDAAGNERGANINASNELLVACSTCSGSGVSATDGAAFVVDTDDVVPFAAIYDTTPGTVTDGDAGVVRMTSERILMVNVDNVVTDSADNAAFANTSTEPPVGVGGIFESSLPTYASGDKATLHTSSKGSLYVTLLENDGDLNPTVTHVDGDAFTSDLDDGVPIFAVYDTTPGTVSDGDAGAVLMTSGRILRVNVDNTVTVSDGSGALNIICDSGCTGGAQYTEDAAAAADPIGNALILVRDDSPGTLVTTDGDNVAARGTNYGALYSTLLDASGVAVPTATAGAGAVDSTTTRVAFATDANVVQGAFTDEGAFTYATSKITAIGAVAESTTDALADGTLGAPVMTLNRQLRMVPTGYLGGGGTGVTYVSAGATEDEHAVCTGPCTLYSITAMNHTAASAFLRCENDTAANTAPGSETASAGEPDIEIPGNTTGAGFTITLPIGVSYGTALTCWIVSGEASSDATEVAANDVRVWYTIQQ